MWKAPARPKIRFFSAIPRMIMEERGISQKCSVFKTEFPKLLISLRSINVLWHFHHSWITADDCDMLLPDSVIKRTHPSNHKKATLNINISSKLLSQNMTASGSPSLTFVWSWYWAGNSCWFRAWKLSEVFPALSQKNPELIMTTFTIGTRLKIWPSKTGSLGQKAKRSEWISVYVL